MKAIENFDKIEVNNFKSDRIPAGGYVVACTNVEDVPEKSQLRLQFDICEGEYKLFFTNYYKEDKREKKFWPRGGSMVRSYNDKSAVFFKAFITSVCESNKNFKWNWDEKALKNQKFGVIIGEEEYSYTDKNGNQRVAVRNYVDNVRSVDTIHSGNFKIPALKKLAQTVETSQPKQVFDNPFKDEASVNNEPVAPSPFDDSENNPFA